MASKIRAQRLTYAKRMVESLEDAIEEGVGVVSVNIDGVSVTFSRQDAIRELDHWRKEQNRYMRSKGRTTVMRLDGCHD